MTPRNYVPHSVLSFACHDRLAMDEAIFGYTSVDRVAVSWLYNTAALGLSVPTDIPIARGSSLAPLPLQPV
jgi:hypothetical protein